MSSEFKPEVLPSQTTHEPRLPLAEREQYALGVAAHLFGVSPSEVLGISHGNSHMSIATTKNNLIYIISGRELAHENWESVLREVYRDFSRSSDSRGLGAITQDSSRGFGGFSHKPSGLEIEK